MTIESITLTVSTNGPTIEDQLEAIQAQRLLDKAIRTAEKFERQRAEIERITSEPPPDPLVVEDH